MSNFKKLMMSAATGGAGLNVEDVFSTYLYTGNGSTQTITNGIDLDGEGGLTWIKLRNSASNNELYDTERGATNSLSSNITNGTIVRSTSLTSFNSDGFTLGAGTNVNANNYTVASWTFRKAPKFFDVVTFTGTGADADVSHNLGAVPAMIIGKRTDAAGNWMVWHIGTGMSNGGFTGLSLNTTASAAFTGVQSDQGINSSTFNTGYVLSSDSIKAVVNGASYVFYLFAHNNNDGEFGPDGDQDIIKCGSFTTDGSGNATVDLGFEPQFVINKTSSSADSWTIADSMRGFNAIGDQRLYANLSNAEATATTYRATSTGFTVNGGETSKDFIYIAIRRGTKVPESATEVFDVTEQLVSRSVEVGTFPVDMSIAAYPDNAGNNRQVFDRLRGTSKTSSKYLQTNTANPEASAAVGFGYDSSSGYIDNFNSVGYNQVYWDWKRAPNFFDVVAYSGDGVAGRTVSHNLGVAPEMIWVKVRDLSSNWVVYHTYKELYLSSSASKENSPLSFNNTVPSATSFSLNSYNSVNGSGYNYIAYLFASLGGVSKVGSYTGNGGTQTIDCGFTSGARFVLIKATNVTGNWIVYDTERGIIVGNDPALALNLTDAELTGYDLIDPQSSGFTVVNDNSSPAAYETNANNVEYIFYAIA